MNKAEILDYVTTWFRRVNCHVDVSWPSQPTPTNFAQFDVVCTFHGLGMVSFSLHAPTMSDMRDACREVESTAGSWLNSLSLQQQTITFALSTRHNR